MLHFPKTYLLLLLNLFPLVALSQTINYDDVAIIVNDSSAVSVSIGNYFAQQRGIPAHHILHVNVSDQETIDDIEFGLMRTQIEAALTANNLQDSINYLVTTKGMPLRVSVNDACDSVATNQSLVGQCTCVESELPLILSPDAGDILQNGPGNNAAFGIDRYFDRDTFGIFLVTRLDAYSEQEVRDLIDRSGPQKFVDAFSAEIVLDHSDVSQGAATVFQQIQIQTANNMVSSGLNVTNDFDNATYLSNQADVVGYFGAHYRPDLLQINNSWAAGSIAHMLFSDVAATFDPGSNPLNHYLLGDMIAEGAGSAAGYTSLTYVGPATRTSDFFPRYFDFSANKPYNVAEAYYYGTPTLSGQNILIADPKSSVVNGIGASVQDELLNAFSLYPNPGAGQFQVQGTLAAGEIAIEVHNLQGQVIFQATHAHHGGQVRFPVGLNSPAAGVYLVRLQAGAKIATKKLIVHR